MPEAEARPVPRGQRFRFIDEFRGLVGVMMLLGHSNYYFNSLWHHFDPLDPLFPDQGQFWLRYMGYLCAPGFLMMNGAMVWYSYTRRRAAGGTDRQAKWHLMQRGLFLVVVQVLWVNSSWGGFRDFRPDHFGIISCIGVSMCLLTLVVGTTWTVRLGLALGLFVVHPYLLAIPYDADVGWQRTIMQLFVDSGEFNKYPVLPWFGMALMGSVMANGWLSAWKTTRERVANSLVIAAVAFLAATAVRMGRGYGNLFPFSEPFSWSFLLDQKYPPSLYHVLWFFGAVVAGVAVFQLLGRYAPRLSAPLGVIGRVPLFFYGVHIAILGIFSKRLDLYYREGAVTASLVGWVIMLGVMMPLTAWFHGVKRRSRNWLVRMI
jgi:uncharacterized membrane protein